MVKTQDSRLKKEAEAEGTREEWGGGEMVNGEKIAGYPR